MKLSLEKIFESAPDEIRREILGILWLAVHDACLSEQCAPEELETDLGFTFAVVERLFESVDVAQALPPSTPARE